MTAATDPGAPDQHDAEMDEAVAAAILSLLAERVEIYPSHIVGELRRRAPDLPADRVRPVLERMFAERRVARLWHRYMLPRAVGEVRTRWLAMIDRQAARLAADFGETRAVVDAYAIVQNWDGWRLGDGRE